MKNEFKKRKKEDILNEINVAFMPFWACVILKIFYQFFILVYSSFLY